MAQQIKGILFDLGDTLLDFGKVDVPLLFEAGARLSYEYLQSLNQPLPPFPAYHRQQLRAIRWSYLKSRFTRREFNSLEVLGRLQIRQGQTLTHEQNIELAWLWYKPLSQQAKVEPGLRQTLQDLRDRGLLTGVVSNTFVPGEVLDRHLQQEGLLELLPIRIYSCDVLFRKPASRIFEIALTRINLPASQLIFVGDSLHADVAGANRAGMISILKDPAGRHVHSKIQPRHRISSIKELTSVLSQYDV